MSSEIGPENPAKRSLQSSRKAIAYIAPSIGIDTVDLTESKIVTINYQDGYIGEYSLDLGKTWMEYSDKIVVSENTTILARTVDKDGNVVRISSFTITTIKPKETQATEPTELKDKEETDDENGKEVINPDSKEGEVDE